MPIIVLYGKVSDVWFIQAYPQLINLLNSSEKKRFDKMKSPLKRQQLVLSRALLLQASQQLLNQQSLDAEITIDNPATSKVNIESYVIENYNKLIINQSITFSISISHSGAIAAVCLSSHQMKVGIDIEKIKPRNFFELSEEICTSQELTILEVNNYSPLSFYKLWTTKEALTKATSCNLRDLFAFDCSNVLTNKNGNLTLNKVLFLYNSICLNHQTETYIGTSVFEAFDNNKVLTLKSTVQTSIPWIYYKG